MIPEHYPIEPGVLYAGEYPGDLDPKFARRRLRTIVDLGVRTFVDLTNPADGLTPYDEILADIGRETGLALRRVSIPVPDMGVPDSPEIMREILGALRESPPAVYVHCWGGVGRTGTATGCWLRESGLNGTEALARVQELYDTHMVKLMRHPRSPQTPGQAEFVRNWQPGNPA